MWSCQYQNEAIMHENAVFRRDHFKLVSTKDIPRNLSVYLLTDTATTTTGDCDSVLFVIGKDSQDNVFVLDASVGQWKPYDYLQRFFSIFTKWRPRHVLLEKNAINDNYATMIEREGIERQCYVKIIWVTGRSMESKDARILAAQARFENKRIFFSEEIPRSLIRLEGSEPAGEIVTQFTRFRLGGGGRKDIPDCLADVDKRDRITGAELCPFPRRTHQAESTAPGVINRRYGRLPGPATVVESSGGDFWSHQKSLSDRRRTGG
jgi:hypothetical protein